MPPALHSSAYAPCPPFPPAQACCTAARRLATWRSSTPAHRAPAPSQQLLPPPAALPAVTTAAVCTWLCCPAAPSTTCASWGPHRWGRGRHQGNAPKVHSARSTAGFQEAQQHGCWSRLQLTLRQWDHTDRFTGRGLPHCHCPHSHPCPKPHVHPLPPPPRPALPSSPRLPALCRLCCAPAA